MQLIKTLCNSYWKLYYFYDYSYTCGSWTMLLKNITLQKGNSIFSLPSKTYFFGNEKESVKELKYMVNWVLIIIQSSFTLWLIACTWRRTLHPANLNQNFNQKGKLRSSSSFTFFFFEGGVSDIDRYPLPQVWSDRCSDPSRISTPSFPAVFWDTENLRATAGFPWSRCRHLDLNLLEESARMRTEMDLGAGKCPLY